LLLAGVFLLERVVTHVQCTTVQRVERAVTTVSEAMWEVLRGIDAAHWPWLRQLVIEVHNVGGRVERVQKLLESYGFAVAVEQDDWALLRLMDVHRVCGTSTSPAAPVACVQ
jgi:hypothetical protein